jgi:hypothetical protein
MQGSALIFVTPLVVAGTLQKNIERVDEVRYRVTRKWCRQVKQLYRGAIMHLTLMLEQILSALGYMHSLGQAHGDLRCVFILHQFVCVSVRLYTYAGSTTFSSKAKRGT